MPGYVTVFLIGAAFVCCAWLLAASPAAALSIPIYASGWALLIIAAGWALVRGLAWLERNT